MKLMKGYTAVSWMPGYVPSALSKLQVIVGHPQRQPAATGVPNSSRKLNSAGEFSPPNLFNYFTTTRNAVLPRFPALQLSEGQVAANAHLLMFLP